MTGDRCLRQHHRDGANALHPSPPALNRDILPIHQEQNPCPVENRYPEEAHPSRESTRPSTRRIQSVFPEPSSQDGQRNDALNLAGPKNLRTRTLRNPVKFMTQWRPYQLPMGGHSSQMTTNSPTGTTQIQSLSRSRGETALRTEQSDAAKVGEDTGEKEERRHERRRSSLDPHLAGTTPPDLMIGASVARVVFSSSITSSGSFTWCTRHEHRRTKSSGDFFKVTLDRNIHHTTPELSQAASKTRGHFATCSTEGDRRDTQSNHQNKAIHAVLIICITLDRCDTRTYTSTDTNRTHPELLFEQGH